ncbi:FAD-dependent oxidoreductase [Roseovarius salis]|uniref:NAD(P)/FAD-dependent oxidoreductase n=1 Tax=Roseovarius salis TaxID=3376063 RepID=UPI0037C8B009
MRVTRLPVDPGPAGWNEILPDPGPAQELEERTTADFLVIGGGFAGLAAVRRLAQLNPGARIVLLEAKRIGEGPAGRNTGFMIDLPHDLSSQDYGGAVEADKAQIRANRAGIDFAAGMAADFGLGEEAFARSGKTNAAATEKGHRHNRDYAAHLARMGEEHEMLDAAQMREMTGSGFYCSGLYTPGTAMIQPALFVRGVARGLCSNRVRIFENSPVTELERNGAWNAVTPKGRVAAPKVILAVNGHANSFGHFRGRLLHVFTYASMTRALTQGECRQLGGQPRWGVTPADPMGTTVRRISGTGGDRIVVRNRFTCDPSMQVSAARIARVARSHDTAFAARFPSLTGVEMEYRWGGRLCLSWNGVPAMGEVEDGLYSACCQNGLGTAKGTMLGMVTAELASGHRSALLDEVMAQDPPKRLPPGPATFIGANAIMRWGEFKAGREL